MLYFFPQVSVYNGQCAFMGALTRTDNPYGTGMEIVFCDHVECTEGNSPISTSVIHGAIKGSERVQVHDGDGKVLLLPPEDDELLAHLINLVINEARRAHGDVILRDVVML